MYSDNDNLGSLHLGEININWDKDTKNKFESLMLAYIISSDYEVNIFDDDDYDVSITSKNLKHYLRFDIQIDKQRNFTSFYCQDYKGTYSNNELTDTEIPPEEMFRVIAEFGEK